jgi:hypothetical protein
VVEISTTAKESMGRPNLMGGIELSDATTKILPHFRRRVGAVRIAAYYPGHISMDQFLGRGRPTGEI